MAKFNKYTKQIDLTEEEKLTFKEVSSDLCDKKTSLPNLAQALNESFVGWEVKTGFENINHEKIIDDQPQFGKDYWGYQGWGVSDKTRDTDYDVK